MQTCQANEADAANQLRTDQAKLSELQEKVDRLDREYDQSQQGAATAVF